jgi:hypothetical protein
MTSRAVCSYKNRLNQCISVGGRSVEVWKKWSRLPMNVIVFFLLLLL